MASLRGRRDDRRSQHAWDRDRVVLGAGCLEPQQASGRHKRRLRDGHGATRQTHPASLRAFHRTWPSRNSASGLRCRSQSRLRDGPRRDERGAARQAPPATRRAFHFRKDCHVRAQTPVHIFSSHSLAPGPFMPQGFDRVHTTRATFMWDDASETPCAALSVTAPAVYTASPHERR